MRKRLEFLRLRVWFHLFAAVERLGGTAGVEPVQHTKSKEKANR